MAAKSDHEMRQIVFLQLFGLILTIKKSFGDPIIVQTKYGKIEGFEYNHSNGKSHVFLGIPFAKPPVGNLRFEKPEEPEAWEDVYQAKQFRNDCSPHHRSGIFSHQSGEDCLTLNIIKPENAKNVPVLIWIHGGGYEVGSASLHDYPVFAEKYTSQGIIVVSIQYRLGFLGFISDGSNDLKGNLGLFDQALALKFIKENIGYFGGDNSQITVSGYSAGAASTSQLTLSPYSRDLFQKTIIMSGSSLGGWTTGFKVQHHSELFLKAVNCYNSNNRKQCLKEKTLDALFDAADIIGATTGTIDFLKWTPVIDGDFLPAHPFELIKEAPKKPTIIGLGDKEGTFFTLSNQLQVITDFGVTEHEASKIDEKYIIDLIQNKLLYENRYGNKQNEVKEKIINYYIHEQDKSIEGYILNQYSEIFSDISFNVPIVREIQRRAEDNSQLFVYRFEYHNEDIWMDHIPEIAKGSPHSNEYHYLFEKTINNEQVDIDHHEEIKVQKDLLDLIITFTKNGKPTIDDTNWTPVQNYTKINYVKIDGKKNEMKTGLFEEPVKFWNGLKDQYGFDLIDPTRSVQKEYHNEL